ncbi:MAG: hypothetical protein EON60_13030 [Alphaproteobacteria bacterium]|nr:MAG: hypothetical protein EON60_13030 [Alphaproteobacteria bacterium]
MALFTLNNASLNPLKYEQLNSEETVTTASSLPPTHGHRLMPTVCSAPTMSNAGSNATRI